jgi:PAS domain S-box-containing protein
MSVRRTEIEAASERALWTRQLLDSHPELECDELVQLAASICGTPIGLVTLLDERHRWYRASDVLKMGKTPREVAFCAHAVRQAGVLMVKDALMDARFGGNPLVTDEPAIRFFAGVGLFREDGELFGTLCVLDMLPRILTAEQAHALEVLGRQMSIRLEAVVQRKAVEQAMAEKELATAGLRASEELFRAFMNASPFLSYIKDAAGRLLFYNRSFAQRFGVSEYAWLGRTDEQLWSRSLTKSVRTHDLEVMAGGTMVETEEHIRNTDGTVSSLRSFKIPCHD